MEWCRLCKGTGKLAAGTKIADPCPLCDDSGSAAAPKAMGCLQVLPAANTTKKDGKKTEHVFLTDTYLFELANCNLLEAEVGAEPPKDAKAGEVKLTIVLDRTIFHPQGGGQPADVGELSANGLPTLKVSFASARKEDGAVLHDCTVAQKDADAWKAKVAGGGVKVHCRIDEQVRRNNARIHSAGHLLDRAVKDLGWNWVPGKGFHFPDGPYVEYVLNDDSRKIDAKKKGDKEELTENLQGAIDSLVAKAGRVEVSYQADVRHVEMAGEICPCGGTHVPEIADLVKVNVKALKNQKGNVRVSYTVAAAA